MNTQDVYELLLSLKGEIGRKIMRKGAFGATVIDMGGVVLENPNDPNEAQKRNELYSMLDKLEDVFRTIEYLSKPILGTGILRRKENGRYELNGLEITSGEEVEILVADPKGEESSYWERTSIEHDGEDYYAVRGLLALEGLIARYR